MDQKDLETLKRIEDKIDALLETLQAAAARTQAMIDDIENNKGRFN